MIHGKFLNCQFFHHSCDPPFYLLSPVYLKQHMHFHKVKRAKGLHFMLMVHSLTRFCTSKASYVLLLNIPVSS